MSWHYLYVFFQSNLLEVVFLLFYYGVYVGNGKNNFLKIALAVTLANSITHPLVIFFFMKGPWSYLLGILSAEIFAFVAEVFFHKWLLNLNYRQATIGSFIANQISWQIGPILTTILFLQDKLS